MAPNWNRAEPLIVMIMVIGQLPSLTTTELPAAAMSSLSPTVPPNCPRTCGNVTLRYPFGISQGCYLNDDFFINCINSSDNNSSDLVSKPYLWHSDFEVLNISTDGELRVSTQINWVCMNDSSYSMNSSSLSLKAFYFSSTRNRFTVIGYNALALMKSNDSQDDFGRGCLSWCSSIKEVVDGDCNGIGCCQTAVPEKLLVFNASLGVLIVANSSKVPGSAQCSYAFLVEEDVFHFNRGYLDGTRMNTGSVVPTVIEWAVWNQTCDEAMKNKTNYACKANSTCTDFNQGAGYRCKCLPGYDGNPYLGCTDIDECANAEWKNHCKGKCTNTLGGYKCSTPLPDSLVFKIVVGVGVGFIVLLLSSCFVHMGFKKRKLMRLKRRFKQNGGLLLQQRLHEHDKSARTVKIFTAEELEKATDRFDESRIVGRGGYGTVYKGFLPNDTVIAIKKSQLTEKSQIEQFINEVVVLSQINHRNVVKLLGCCLETEVPLLVYEFVSNGTLYDHLHNPNKSKMTWEARLRIAAETASVLSYLHSTASVPIIHRDVKSTNILLDDNCTSKVSDFGASRLVPLDQTQMYTMVQGTLGYLDPEYLQTSQLTEKSDVYSFGVVLIELMTGKKALSFDRPEEERSLAMHFLSALKEDRLFEILEEFIVNEENSKRVKEVAHLAKRCVRVKGEERPSMREVALELEGLRAMAVHPWVSIPLDPEEAVHLLGNTSDSGVYSDTGVEEFTDSSMKKQFVPAVSGGR